MYIASLLDRALICGKTNGILVSSPLERHFIRNPQPSYQWIYITSFEGMSKSKVNISAINGQCAFGPGDSDIKVAKED